MAYEGGRILCFDPKNNQTTDYGIVHPAEGIITIAMDVPNGKLYALTIPSGYLVQFDLSTKNYKKLGKIPSNGSICRTITVGDGGKVYGSFEDDGLFIFNPSTDKLELKARYFPSEQVEEWAAASRGGVNKVGRKLWRCITYDEKSNALYGVYSTSSRCFKIDCETRQLEMYDSMVPSGYGNAANVYPTLSLTGSATRLFYAPADGMFDYCRSDNMHEMAHLMSYDKTTSEITDLGELSDRGRRVYGVAGAALSGSDVFFLGAVESNDSHAVSHKEDELFRVSGKPFELGLIRVVL